jgi:hypothetical protein
MRERKRGGGCCLQAAPAALTLAEPIAELEKATYAGETHTRYRLDFFFPPNLRSTRAPGVRVVPGSGLSEQAAAITREKYLPVRRSP